MIYIDFRSQILKFSFKPRGKRPYDAQPGDTIRIIGVNSSTSKAHRFSVKVDFRQDYPNSVELQGTYLRGKPRSAPHSTYRANSNKQRDSANYRVTIILNRHISATDHIILTPHP